jgi:hypothetical protein
LFTLRVTRSAHEKSALKPHKFQDALVEEFTINAGQLSSQLLLVSQDCTCRANNAAIRGLARKSCHSFGLWQLRSMGPL